MSAAEKRLDVIAQNLANSSAAGFKRQVGTVNSFEEVVNGVTRRGQGLRTEIDFQQGSLIETGNELDLALLGDGFFAFEDGDEVAYTRDGSLRLTEAGDLVSKTGKPIVWEVKTAQVNPTGEPIRIDSGGNVFQANSNLGQLKLVDFENRQKLLQDEHGYFHKASGTEELPATGEIHAGTYEAANVQPVAEMVEMILAQRAYQSASNTVKQIAESYRRLNQAR
jgi:flagellar basal body rod protein FlgG